MRPSGVVVRVRVRVGPSVQAQGSPRFVQRLARPVRVYDPGACAGGRAARPPRVTGTRLVGPLGHGFGAV